MPLVVLNGPTIVSGTSLSGPIDCTAGHIVRITMPAAWSSAPLTFQFSSDGAGFNDLYSPEGKEIIFEVRPGSGVLVPTNFSAALAFVKFRSGLGDHPINQAAHRQFAIAIETK